MSNYPIEFLHALLQQHKNPTFIFHVNGYSIISSNQSFEILINSLSAEKDNRTLKIIINLLSDEEKGLLIGKLNQSISKRVSSSILVHPIYSNKPQSIWEFSFTPILIKEQPIEYLTCTITEQSSLDKPNIQFKQNFSTDNIHFKALFDEAPLGVCVLRSPELITEYANDNILKLWGRTRSELIGFPQEVARPELKNQTDVIDKVKNIFTTGKPLVIEEVKVSTLVLDGYFSAVYQPLTNERNEVTSILIILRDISQQVIFKKELQKAKDILKLAMDASDMGSWNVDLASKKVVFSERAKQIYELDDYRLDIEEAKSFIVEEHLAYFTNNIKKALHHRSGFNLEYQIRLTENKTKWVRVAGKAYYDKDGKPLYIAGAILDITEQKQDEIRKNDFIGMVSHELKTPLTSLSAYVQLLQYKKSGSNDFTTDILDKVSIQLKRMSIMIDGFLNVSLLESGKITLNKTYFDLNDLIQGIAEENRLILPSHFIQVIECKKVMIYADWEKIATVVNNLISNAAKYSGKDSLIAIKCDSNKNECIISVEDEGIGIKSNDIPKLFERFYRVDSPSTKTIAGFGVGLYICSEVIKRHNGRIWVESEYHKGSTFYFSLPLNTKESNYLAIPPLN
jgi:PAS domain S-box-containing protein